MLNRTLICIFTLLIVCACDDGDDPVDPTTGGESAGAEAAGGGATGGGATGGGDQAGASGETYASFIERAQRIFAELTCEAYLTCAAEGRVSSAGLSFFLNRHSSVESCADDFGRLIPISSQADAVDMGLIIFDASLATECLNEIEAINISSCDETLNILENLPEGCELAVRGTVESGGACSASEQCVDGYCELSGEEICEIGVCALNEEEEAIEEGTAMLGDPCESSEECASGLLCSNTTTVCAEPSWHAEGDTCELGGAKLCNPGLICQLDFTTFAQTCTQPIAIGGACIFGPQCEIGLTCLNADLENGTPGTCGALSAAGGPCGLSIDCADGLSCTYTGDEGVCSDMVEECALPMSPME